MDDAIFKLLEQMQANIMNKFDEVNQRFDGVEKEIKDLKEEQSKIRMVLENETNPDIKLSLQGYHDTNEKLTTIEGKLDTLSDKVDRHDIKIQVIEGGKRA